MYIDKEHFDSCIEKIFQQLKSMDSSLQKLSMNFSYVEGERLMDTQDVCQVLKVGKRTLQRYRSSGQLPYQTIHRRTYYKESDVKKFIEYHFNSKDEHK